MPVPSQSHITLVGGLNSTNSTIYTNSLIKTGDTIKVTGTTSNNSVYTVIDVVTTGSTGEKVGTTFTDATCDTTEDDATVTHDANAQIVAGLSVAGSEIPTGISVYITSITDQTHFEMNRPADDDGTDVTLTFGDMDIYYCVKGGTLTDENSGGDGLFYFESDHSRDNEYTITDTLHPGTGSNLTLGTSVGNIYFNLVQTSSDEETVEGESPL